MADSTDTGITFPDSITINTKEGNPIEVKLVDTSNITKELAMMLYSYADFSKIPSNKDFARLCIQRAKDFAEVYSGFINKNI